MKFINVLLIHKLRYWILYNFLFLDPLYTLIHNIHWDVSCNLLLCHFQEKLRERGRKGKFLLYQIMRMTIMNALHRSIVFNKINKSINFLFLYLYCSYLWEKCAKINYHLMFIWWMIFYFCCFSDIEMTLIIFDY